MIDKTTLFIGFNDKDSLTQKINTLDASNIITNILAAASLDCTISEAVGVYTMQETKKVTIEKTLRVEILFCDKSKIENAGIIPELKKVLNQETIAVQFEKIDSYIM